MGAFPPVGATPGKLLALVDPWRSTADKSEADTMAKQNSAPDPVSVAMSAIESALNLTDDDNFTMGDGLSVAAPVSVAKPMIVTPVLKPAAPSGDSPVLK
jgi:hypothetical protein